MLRIFSVVIVGIVNSERKSSRMIKRLVDLLHLSVEKRVKINWMILIKTKRSQRILLDSVSYPEATHQHGVNLPAVSRACLVDQAV